MQKVSAKLPFFIKRINEMAILPVKGSERAAGFDLFSCSENIVPARGKSLIKTGLQFAVPHGNYARIAPRSGLALKNSIDVGGGVIDEDYRGEVGIILFNHSDQDFTIKIGDRVAQVIIEKISDTEIIEVDSLDQTERGEGGFGSTGVTNDNQFWKRKSNVLKEVYTQQQEIKDENYEQKEIAIVDLYGLCQENIITVEQKKKLCYLVMKENNQELIKFLQKYNNVSKQDKNINNLQQEILKFIKE